MKNSYFNKTLNFAKLNSSSVVSFDLLQNLLDGTDLSVEEINAIEEVLAGMVTVPLKAVKSVPLVAVPETEYETVVAEELWFDSVTV